jgi:hypothetical protein
VAPQDRVVPIHFPEDLGHGNLGPNSKGMSRTARSVVKVPDAIGRWETTLDSRNIDISASAMSNCSVALGVVFMEEDSTLDSTIKNAVQELKPEVRRTANSVLRLFLGVMPDVPDNFPGREAILAALQAYRQQLMQSGLDPNGLLNGSSLMDKVLDKVLPKEIGKAIGKTFIPGGELINLIAAAIQGADKDEYVGANGISFRFADIVGLNHAPRKFELESEQYTSVAVQVPGVELPPVRVTSKGIYAVDGAIRRTDTDEVPILALVRGPGSQVVSFARRLDGDHFARRRSDNFGGEWSVVQSTAFSSRDFKSGPGAASAAGGARQCVAGRSTDDEIWFNYSEDAGAAWRGWTRVSQRRTFISSPAVALSHDGNTIYLTARESDNTYWLTQSTNRGETWAPWRRIGTGVFHSSPAMVCLSVPERPTGKRVDHLVVAGLGTNKRVYFTRLDPDATFEGQDWDPISPGSDGHPTSEFTSAPAMASDGRDHVVLVCRARNLLFWRCESHDGGRRFKVGTSWQPIGRPDDGRVRYESDGDRRGDLQDMYSAPAIAASDDMDAWVLTGLTPTLSLWSNKSTRQASGRWRSVAEEPEKDLRPHFY